MADYIAPTYEMNPFIEAFRNAPRFGHGNDVSKLFSSNSMMADYLIGALVLAMIFLSFFGLWMLLLSIFMCCGPARVGFLAGFAFREPDTNLASNYGRGKVFKLPRRIRTVFVFSCLLVIASAINAYIFSLNGISQSSRDAIESLEGLQTIGKNGRKEANTLGTEGQKSMNLAVTVADSLNREKFCVNNLLDENVDGNRSAVVDHLLILGDYFTDNEISLMEDAVFAEIEKRSESTISFISSYGVHHWQTLFYLVAFTAIPALMLLGTLLTWCDKPIGALNGMLTWFFLPFFILFITLSWLIVALFSFVMVMISDFCSGSQSSVGPDSSLLNILTETVSQDGLLFEGSSYWINGCKSEFPFSFFTNYSQSVDEALVAIDNFVSSMEEYGLDNLSASCGGKDFQIIVDYMETISEDYTELGTMSDSISDLVLCESINPLYVDLAHDTTCTELPPLLVIALSLLFAVSFLGMIMITFRSSWLEVIRRDQIEDYEFPIPSPQSQKNLQDVGLGEYEDASVHSSQGDGSEHAKIGESSRASLDGSLHSNHASDTSPSNLEKMSVAVDDDALKDIPPTPGKAKAFKVY